MSEVMENIDSHYEKETKIIKDKITEWFLLSIFELTLQALKIGKNEGNAKSLKI